MASFVIVDVFTQERWTGNQLAIVALQDRVISHDHMQKIAREFNFSETVFIHGRHDGQDVPRISIFTPVNEMDFAGHPIIGTGHALFQKFLGDALPSVTPKQNVERVVKTKAGLITLQYDQTAGNVSAQVPHNVHIQTEPTPARAILDTQAGLRAYEAIMEDFYPTISIVKGVSYVLVDLSGKPDLFGAVKASASPQALLDDEWKPSFVGTMYYQALDDFQDQDGVYSQSLRVRMIAINLEDPACGSGCCSLGAYLALRHGKPAARYRFSFDQGEEIGRPSHIVVLISLDESGSRISSVLLSGQAALVAEGKLVQPE